MYYDHKKVDFALPGSMPAFIQALVPTSNLNKATLSFTLSKISSIMKLRVKVMLLTLVVNVGVNNTDGFAVTKGIRKVIKNNGKSYSPLRSPCLMKRSKSTEITEPAR